jgi:hypothetical protein
MPVTLHRPHLHRCPLCREPVTVSADGCGLCGADLEAMRWRRAPLPVSSRVAIALAVSGGVGLAAWAVAHALTG